MSLAFVLIFKIVLKKYLKYYFFLVLSVSVFYQLNQFLVRNDLLVDLNTYDDISFSSIKDILVFLLYMVLIFPVLEELSFRLILVKKPVNTYLGFCFLLGFTPYTLNTRYGWLDLGLFYEFGILLITVFLLILIFKRFELKLFEVFEAMPSKQILVYSSILFALFHFGKLYKSDIVILSFVPLLKHFVSGFVFGTFRIKYGFIHGFFLHALNNLVASLGVILAFYRS